MVNVQFAAFSPTDEHPPSGVFAHQAWMNNPRLSPSAYRSALGLTLSKTTLDCRAAVPAGVLDYLQAGVNSFIVSPTTLAELTSALASHPREQLVIGLASEHLPQDLAELCTNTTYLDAVWLQHAQPEDMIQLEKLVQAGALLAYGPWGNNGWNTWLGAAPATAHAVYGRRKRTGLRSALLYLAGGAWHAATHAVPPFSESLLDTAASQGWLTVAEGCSHWHVDTTVLDLAAPATPLAPAAQDALTALATAEHALAGALGGWPHSPSTDVRPAQPVFAVGHQLQQGCLPWASRAEYAAWHQHIWPLIENLWQQSVAPEAARYLAAWRAALPHGASLAGAAEVSALGHILSSLEPCLPNCWQQQPWPPLSAGLVGSTPGVTSVAVRADFMTPTACTAVLERPDITDMAAIIKGDASS